MGTYKSITLTHQFVHDKLKVTQKMISVFDRLQNIAKKGESACFNTIFSFFQQCFQNHFYFRVTGVV